MNGLALFNKVVKSLAIFSLLGVIAACNISPASTSLFGNLTTLSTCYQVRYLGFSQEPNDISTWNYRVEKLSCAEDFNGWILQIPACAAVVDASPASYQVVQPDPGSQLNWVQWQKGSTFQGGDFSVKLSGKLKRGTTQVGVVGSSMLTGEIQGPVCGLNATTSTMTTLSFTPGTTSPTPIPSATRPSFKTVTSAPPTFLLPSNPTKEPAKPPTTVPTSPPTNAPTLTSTAIPTNTSMLTSTSNATSNPTLPPTSNATNIPVPSPTSNSIPTNAPTASPIVDQGTLPASTDNPLPPGTQTQKP